MPEKILIGVDIGGTKTAVSLSHVLPCISRRIVFPTEPELGHGHCLYKITEGINNLLTAEGLSRSDILRRSDILSIGVSCGGPLDSVKGVIQSPPNLPTWNNVPICDHLSRSFNAVCSLQNDANACAVAEYRFGAGVGAHNFIFLTMGTGFGAGLILGGRLYQGSSYNAGEIGHVRLSRSGPFGYGKIGSVEGWVSGGGLAQAATSRVNKAISKNQYTLLSTKENISAKDIVEAASAGDMLAESLVDTVAAKLGAVLAMLMDILNPDCIAIGGLAVRLGDKLLGPAIRTAMKEALPGTFSHCKVVPAALGESVGDMAALCIASENIPYEMEEADLVEST